MTNPVMNWEKLFGPAVIASLYDYQWGVGLANNDPM